jgi:glyoxylase-like metal-dependent hydrolase (beta-lactamase superfamily II)
VGTIDKAHHVERVRTWIANDVLGDMPVEVAYSGYKDFGGVQFPARIVQTQGGYPALDLTISEVKKNPTVDISVPDNVRSAAAPAAPTVQSTKLADGVFYLTGGSHHSMAVDMGDHIVVVEAPLNEARSEAVIAETKKVIPNKPIRYVVNTHVHFDHSGGLRTYVDEGATVVTHQANQAFYQKAWSAPRTLNPDRLSNSKKTAKFTTVTDKRVLTGAGGRTIELHLIKGNPHNAELLMAWLPADKILFQSDMFQPLNPNQAVPPPSPTLTNFSENLTRLNIKPEQIPGGHGSRAGTMADLNKALGKSAQQ